MVFRSDMAVQTLGGVLDELIAVWDTLAADVRADVEALIRRHGPKIADRTADRFNVVSRICDLLDALWQIRSRLPASVVRILEAGRAEAAGYRGSASVSDALREELLNKMLPIADFRVYDDAPRLASQVDDLISKHQDRLLPDERSRWQGLLAAFRRDGDATAYLREVEKLLGAYPAVRQLIQPHKDWTPQRVYRDGSSAFALSGEGVPKGAASLPASGEAGPEPGEVSRYANVYFPSKVLVTQQRVPLVVHVAAQYGAKGVFSADEARVSLKMGDLTVVVFAQDFDVVQGIGGQPGASGEAERSVAVAGDRDCEPVIFFLNPRSAGKKSIQVSLRQFGREVRALTFGTEVVADAAALHDLANVSVEPVAIVSPARGAKAPPPDLELRVMLKDEDKGLLYYLHSPGDSDYNFKFVGQVDLKTNPLTFLKGTFDRLSALAKQSAEARSAAQSASAVQELAKIGRNLFESLFPAGTGRFKDEYRKFREKYRGKSLLITSDDPWIPWEMVRPYLADDDGNVIYDDPPLCEMFQVSRWLSGRGAPDQLKMRQGVWVAPPDNLQAAQEESDYFADLQRRQWQVALAGPLSTLAEVEDRLQDGGTQFFHFACHGNFNTDDPNESKLKLAGDFLSPRDISGTVQTGLRKAKPVVFLNACYGGRVGVGLTQLGGWAEKFIEAGVSAFIGSLWEINDVLAARFAREFYDRLWGVNAFAGKPQPLGQAFFQARMAIKAADEANPTWLAYVLYGDPYGQVVLGDQASG